MVSNIFSDTPEPDGKKSNKIEPEKRDDIKRMHHTVIRSDDLSGVQQFEFLTD
jgi:hypothetical protein